MHTHTYTHKHTHTHTNTHTQTHIQTHTYTYACTHTYTHKHTYTHTYTHTHTHYVRLLWTRDRAVVETPNKTQHPRETYPCPRRGPNAQSEQASGRSPSLRPRGHRDGLPFESDPGSD